MIAHAIRQGAEQGDHVTSDQFKAGLALPVPRMSGAGL